LIAPRGGWEKRWRRLPFFLAFESRDLVASDEQLAFQCSRIVVEDIFHALSDQWDSFLDLAVDHISILEDHIYENPADETRAPELWMNSSLWMKVEKLIYTHLDVIKDLAPRLEELTGTKQWFP
jgi:Mg2+ and Co2+ transporter CorA